MVLNKRLKLFAVILLNQIDREYYGNYLVRQWIRLVIKEIMINMVSELICSIVIF